MSDISSAQYDSIASKYEDVKKTPHGVMEEHTLRILLEPYIKGAKVLDIPCGTGYYSKKFLEWGAASVTGVDISEAMIDIAKDATNAGQHKSISYHVADGAVPTKYPGGPFDLVVGCWLLNYAPDAAQMTQMYMNISQNLTDKGTFIGLCPEPSKDKMKYIEMLENTQSSNYPVNLFLKEVVQDGVKVRVKMYRSGEEPIEFDSYLLNQEIYDTCARDGNMKGQLHWEPISIPEDARISKEIRDRYLQVPIFGMLVVKKK